MMLSPATSRETLSTASGADIRERWCLLVFIGVHSEMGRSGTWHSPPAASSAGKASQDDNWKQNISGITAPVTPAHAQLIINDLLNVTHFRGYNIRRTDALL